MIEKVFWLILAIIMIFAMTENKTIRIALITLFVLTFIDGVFFGGVYGQFLILGPFTMINNLMIDSFTGLMIWTYEITDYLVIVITEIIRWLMTPLGLFWASIISIVLVLVVVLQESISKIPRIEK